MNSPLAGPLSGDPEARIDTTVPHSARVWNYWLGGKDNYEVDRQVGDQYRASFPGIDELARASRHFLTRSVRWLAEEAGVRQFLDVGTGLPTVDNTHEVAQRVAPASRIVYVDNDPLVLVHAHALLTSSPEGETAYIEADLADPAAILEKARETLDFSQPIALILSGILGHVADYDEARRIVRGLMAGLPSGSYLSQNDGTDDDAEANQAQDQYNDSGAVAYNMRSPRQIAAYYEGLELVEPGVVMVNEWHPETLALTPAHVAAHGGVARKS